MQRPNLLITIIVATMLMVLGILSLMQPVAPVAADTVPTPVYGTGYGSDALPVTLLATEAFIADDTATNGVQIYTFEYCNAQYIVDKTDTNATTMTAQWSMDNSTWSAGPVVINANTADGDGLVQIPMLGRYMGFDVNVANTNPITISVKAICK